MSAQQAETDTRNAARSYAGVETETAADTFRDLGVGERADDEAAAAAAAGAGVEERLPLFFIRLALRPAEGVLDPMRESLSLLRHLEQKQSDRLYGAREVGMRYREVEATAP